MLNYEFCTFAFYCIVVLDSVSLSTMSINLSQISISRSRYVGRSILNRKSSELLVAILKLYIPRELLH